MIWLLLFAALILTLLLTERLDRHASDNWPSFERMWARLGLDDTPEQPQHVRVLGVSVSPGRCPGCGSTGWHDQGCSWLDRMDGTAVHGSLFFDRDDVVRSDDR